MLIDVIIDSVIYVGKGDLAFKMNKQEWVEYLDSKIKEYPDWDCIKYAKQALEEEDWKRFKLNLIHYMWDNNNGGSWAYNQFNRLSLKKLREIIL